VKGLTVRWSLEDAPDEVVEELRAYVADSSHARFTDLRGLHFKTWRMRPGQWFEGCYVFADDQERSDFQRTFAQGAEESPGSRIIGSAPILIEECDIVAVAEGQDGFRAASRF
jgi:hypothetical protein